MIEPLLLAVTRVTTVLDKKEKTNATGFFFERDGRVYLVTARHVLRDEASDHHPDSLLIELHVDPDNAVQVTRFMIPLFRNGRSVWREGIDSAGEVDVAVIELDRPALPATLLLKAFTPNHLVSKFEEIEVGTPIVIVGFPLGFHDMLHHLPVARQAIVATSFGLRFQGEGYFLTDAQMHRGASGAPVVARAISRQSGREDLSWLLLGVHTSRMDVHSRDVTEDERLNLNCAWYADIIMKLTQAPGADDFP
ncbi:MAG TPA: serine protease [Burkholderiales bacterium]|nr:serine protease [Burkholderiales bacterium]